MTRHYNGIPETDTTYEDRTTGAVLAHAVADEGDTMRSIAKIPIAGGQMPDLGSAPMGSRRVSSSRLTANGLTVAASS